MNNIDLCSLLGKPVSDPEIMDMLSLLHIDPAKVRLKRGDFTAYAVNEKRGMELLFQQDFAVLEDLNDSSITQTEIVSEKIKNMKNYPEGTLFLTAMIIRDNYILDNGYDVNQLE